MKLLDRLLIFMFVLIVAILSIFLIAYGFDLIHINDVIKYIQFNRFKYIYGVVGILILISCGLFLISGMNDGERLPNYNSIILTSNFGDIAITYNTLISLTDRKTRSIDGIRPQGIHIERANDKISIIVDITISPDINIPNVVKSLQKEIKDYIENMTSIYIDNIKINVMNLSTSLKMRVK